MQLLTNLITMLKWENQDGEKNEILNKAELRSTREVNDSLKTGVNRADEVVEKRVEGTKIKDGKIW